MALHAVEHAQKLLASWCRNDEIVARLGSELGLDYRDAVASLAVARAFMSRGMRVGSV